MTKARGARQASAALPVGRVLADVNLSHLDRPFDYLIPAELAAAAVPGCRVRVRFAGRLVDGFLIQRLAESDHPGRLAFIEKVVSAEPVLDPQVLQLAQAVAARYAGSLADVIRLAVPPRHAAAEQAVGTEPGGGTGLSSGTEPGLEPGAGPSPADFGVDRDAWRAYPAGPAFLASIAAGRPARAVLTVAPGEDWPQRIAEAITVVARGGRGALALVPDARDLERLAGALDRVLGPDSYVNLHASLGPSKRYRQFLRASRGAVSVVIGTRAAVFAPVRRLGLVVIWDDGDDLYAEPRSPYPHALQVLLMRAQQAEAGALIAGATRSCEAQLLVETGWAKELVARREVIRARAPAVIPTGEDFDRARDAAAASARLPSLAWRAAREALAAGAPVLVQVSRRGYLPAVACLECQTPARCRHCAGPLQLGGEREVPTCRWCARPAADYSCTGCGGRRLRAAVIGAARTAEELGRAFAGTQVRTSGRDGILSTVEAKPVLVVATPGAEPIAAGGYGAVLLLDTWALLARADLRAGEEALRRWFAAASLARPARDGGKVVVVADGGLATVQALLRWDPATFAARELAERRQLGFPPAVRMASLTGSPAAVAEILELVRLPDGAAILGPVAVGEEERALVRVASRAAGGALAEALHAAAGVRSARKADGSVRIQIDPRDLW